jgi:hypothetical protein
MIWTSGKAEPTLKGHDDPLAWNRLAPIDFNRRASAEAGGRYPHYSFVFNVLQQPLIQLCGQKAIHQFNQMNAIQQDESGAMHSRG